MNSDSLAAFTSHSRTSARQALADGEPLLISADLPVTLTAALRRTARMFPDKGIRFIGPDQAETFESYPTLLEKASRISAGLLAAGLKSGTTAILQFDDLQAHFAAFWGCLLAGIAPVTVAIAPTYKERNGVVDKLWNTWSLLKGPPILTRQNLSDRLADLRSLFPADVFNIFTVENLRSDTSMDLCEPQPSDLAFLQLSSGSTGVPKIIQETHRAVIAHVHSSAQFNGYRSDDVTFNWLPLDHVVPILTFHLKDVYLGCNQVHAPTALVLEEPLRWLDLLDRSGATHTWSPNFGFKLVSDRLKHCGSRQWNLSKVKFFMNAGEQVTLPVVRDFLEGVAPFGVRESAMQPAFGMAEVCTCMTYANQFSVAHGATRWRKSSLDSRLEPTREENADAVEFVSLGKVTPGISIRIADSANRALPEDVIGRLQIKGPVVTPGYLNNDEANHDAFVGDGWFNTGDLGFIHESELFLTGREKEMIIVRGAKFYCYEVEDVINRLPGVEPTFVAACGIEDAESGTERLAVFFTPAGITDELNLTHAVRRRVTERLAIAPAFVIPLRKDHFPKTTSGKIQRAQLKKLLQAGAFQSAIQEANAGGANAGREPRGQIELRVAAIWRDILGVPQIPADESLFNLGGDSLKATQIVSRVRAQWKIDLPFHLLFDSAGTVAGMARWLEQNSSNDNSVSLPPVQSTTRHRQLPLSSSQLRIWLAEQIEPGTSLYNICRSLSLKGPLDAMILERSLREIVRRHEILRTIYRLEDAPVQKVLPELALTMPRHDLSHLPAPERQRISGNLTALDASRPFDLATGPLLRAKLIRLGHEDHLLVLTFHQVVTDAWSIGVFFRELSQLYESFAAGRDNSLSPLTVQYADYAVWQHRWFSDAALAAQLEFWKQELSPAPPPLRLAASGGAQPVSNAGAAQKFTIPKELLQKVRAFNTAEGVSLHMMLLTVYRLLLADWTRETDLLMGSPESGRRQVETESLLGYFVNVLPVRTRISPRESFRTHLHRVRETTFRAVAHADVPFEKILSVVPSKRSGGGSDLLKVWFGPIDSLQPFRLGEAQATPALVFPSAAQFELSCFVAEQPDEVVCFFEYQKERVAASRISKMLQQFERVLRRAVVSPDLSLEQLLREPAPAQNSESTRSSGPEAERLSTAANSLAKD